MIFLLRCLHESNDGDSTVNVKVIKVDTCWLKAVGDWDRLEDWKESTRMTPIFLSDCLIRHGHLWCTARYQQASKHDHEYQEMNKEDGERRWRRRVRRTIAQIPVLDSVIVWHLQSLQAHFFPDIDDEHSISPDPFFPSVGADFLTWTSAVFEVWGDERHIVLDVEDSKWSWL